MQINKEDIKQKIKNLIDKYNKIREKGLKKFMNYMV